MKIKPHDYLKYWKVIRQYYKTKHKLNQSDLDMLLFLYSEVYFSKQKFKEFANIVSWDTCRFARLMAQDWICVFRKQAGSKKTLYQLSPKAERVIESMYKKLNGEEIPMSPSSNPMFLKNVKYTDKVYRNMIIEMNAFIKQQRHQPPEQ